MFVPPTLWPFNVQDLLADCLTTLNKGKRLNSRHRLLFGLLPEPPDETVCAVVADYELRVQKGNYENVVKTQPNTLRTNSPSARIQNFVANGRVSRRT